MNIFKVIASGKKPFAEEQMSAVLAWLLHPQMEHGLGNQMLIRFVKAIGIDDMDDLRHSFRDNNDSISCALEYYVEGLGDRAFIDIVYFVEKYVIAIENKIYSSSVSKDQLKREFNGIMKEFPDKKVILVYLLPELPENDNVKSSKEYNQLNADNKKLISWKETICDIIGELLADESIGKIEPIPEYTRHTLKALSVFARSDFKGYDYEKASGSGGDNPSTQGRYSVVELQLKKMGFVGVQHGLSGLVKMSIIDLKKMKFQYTEIDMSSKINWISLRDFIELAEWLIYDKEPDFKWDTKLDALSINKLVSRIKNNNIYVGIRGGEDALRQMDKESIQDKRWGIKTTDNPPTSQWIKGETFWQILVEKGIVD